MDVSYHREHRECGEGWTFLTAENTKSAEKDRGFLPQRTQRVQKRMEVSYRREHRDRGEEWMLITAENAEIAEMTEEERKNRITEIVIGAAIEVHRALGLGLLESAYESCLAFELVQNGFKAEQQKLLPIIYKEVKLDCGYRLDLLVEKSVIVEIKAVDQLAPIHKAQVLSYLKLSGCKVGLLINFNTKMLKNGIMRLVNDFPTSTVSAASAIEE
jgi:GxxExxY protein